MLKVTAKIIKIISNSVVSLSNLIEDKHNTFDFIAKILTVGGGLLLIYIGWQEHVELRNADFQKSYYEKRIETIVTTNQLIENIDLAHEKYKYDLKTNSENIKQDEEKLSKLIFKFGELYHGNDQIFFTHEMYSGLYVVWDHINHCIKPNPPEYFKKKKHAYSCNVGAMFTSRGFQIAASKALAQGVKIKIDTDPFNPYNQ